MEKQKKRSLELSKVTSTTTLNFITSALEIFKSNNFLDGYFPTNIYTRDDLFGGYKEENMGSATFDNKVINYVRKLNSRNYFMENIHDTFIDLYLQNYMTNKKTIGVMGHYSTSRENKTFLDVALLCQSLAKKGFSIIHAGGPGLMEAASFGAYLSSYSPEELIDSLTILKQAPTPKDPLYIAKAFEVINQNKPYKKNKGEGLSIAVPTWAFSTEPTNVFSDVFAKFFDDGKREYVLLEQSKKGIIYAPGGSGTLQEFFEGIVIHSSIQSKVPLIIYKSQEENNLEKEIIPLIKMLRDKKKLDLIISDKPQEIQNYIQNLSENNI
ncbi:MAG: hypothetical protein GY830_09570 [Bacteroidetes bacterium]|nr:hypothetical protein [Bacteroidota bacterium]